ncbi:MAG: hypothetical protein IT514_07250 [Burkholderiales bacterium]|nr:hypothetical protein [Burkholderiales bacterium]
MICLAAGLVLALGFHRVVETGTATAVAGQALGALLAMIGVFLLASNFRRTVIVDPQARQVLIRDRSRFRARERAVPFRTIAEVRLEELGDIEGGSISYDVVLVTRGGETVPLFRPAFFDGAFHRPTMEQRCKLIQRYLDA